MPAVKEFTYKELKGAIDWNFLRARERVRQLRKRGTRYAGLRGMSVFFRTFSSNYEKNGLVYTQEIKLLDLPEALGMADISLRDKVKLAMGGDIAIRCTCPAFLYWGFAYILTQLDAKVTDPENRNPRIRNPELRSVMCKHLALVMEVFGAHWNSIERDLKSQGYE